MKRLGNDGWVKGFFTLLVLAALAVGAAKIGVPYYRYNTLRSHTKDALLLDLNDPEAVRKKVMEDAAELQIPLEPENVQVAVNSAKQMKVRASWSEVVDFWGYYQKQLDFEFDTGY